MPRFFFKSRDVAKHALVKRGDMLQMMPQWNDDEELVALAIKNHSASLASASDRLKNDFDTVMLAIANYNDGYGCIDGFYEGIGDDLKLDREIVLAIAKCKRPPKEFPPEEYRDDDEVGALLADDSERYNRWALLNTSDRIKERYMTKKPLVCDDDQN